VGAEVARTALQTLADEKLKDAQVLLAAKSWSNAYYLAGYAIELALKACIAKTFKAETIPDKDLVLATYRHKFRELVGTAGLSAELQKKEQSEQGFAANWGVVNLWSPDARYASWTEEAATELIAAVSDPKDGVLVWIRSHW
jgi:hypothetical protein